MITFGRGFVLWEDERPRCKMGSCPSSFSFLPSHFLTLFFLLFLFFLLVLFLLLPPTTLLFPLFFFRFFFFLLFFPIFLSLPRFPLFPMFAFSFFLLVSFLHPSPPPLLPFFNPPSSLSLFLLVHFPFFTSFSYLLLVTAFYLIALLCLLYQSSHELLPSFPLLVFNLLETMKCFPNKTTTKKWNEKKRKSTWLSD